MEIVSTTVQLDTPDGKMEAYEARPKDSGSYPAIVVLMEAFGVNAHIKDVTERIAREAYVAFAPDLYHREPERVVSYQQLPKAVAIMQRLQDSKVMKVMEDVGAAIAHLKAQSYVKPSALGGHWVLHGRTVHLSERGALQPGF